MPERNAAGDFLIFLSMKVGNALFKLEGGEHFLENLLPARVSMDFFHFHPHFEEDVQFDEHIFQMGWELNNHVTRSWFFNHLFSSQLFLKLPDAVFHVVGSH